MFCTRCGTELREEDKFCFNCGAATPLGAATRTTWTHSEQPLTRWTSKAKVAGVCAGFARYFGLDVTLVRVIWLVLSVWPLPLFGVVAYIVAWIVMPKDPVTAVQVRTVNG